jgi:5,10-methenyltetrahydromethanopterin hydrogenase
LMESVEHHVAEEEEEMFPKVREVFAERELDELTRQLNSVKGVQQRETDETIRLIFDQPLALGRILLRFDEKEQARTQEFVLSWLPEGQQSRRETVRQQFTFSPPATDQEIED